MRPGIWWLMCAVLCLAALVSAGDTGTIKDEVKRLEGELKAVEAKEHVKNAEEPAGDDVVNPEPVVAKPTEDRPTEKATPPSETLELEKRGEENFARAEQKDEELQAEVKDEKAVVEEETTKLASEDKSVEELKRALAKAKEEGFCNILQNLADSLDDARTLTEERKIRRTHNFVCGMLTQMHHDLNAEPVTDRNYCQSVSSTLSRFADHRIVRELRKQRRTHAYLCGVLNDMGSSLAAKPHHNPGHEGEDPEVWKGNCRSEYLCGLMSGLSSELGNVGGHSDGECTNTCAHGTAKKIDGSCACSCHAGWKGDTCDQDDGKADDTCGNDCGEHGAKWRNGEDNCVCKCNEGWHGDACDAQDGDDHSTGDRDVVVTVACPDTTCAHGTAKKIDGSCACSCHAGWKGDTCDQDDGKADDTCGNDCGEHGAKWRNGEDNCVCKCNEGWTGDKCTKEDNHNPGNNQGGIEIVTCHMDGSECGDNAQGFDRDHCRCRCKNGWEGVLCDKDAGGTKPTDDGSGVELVHCKLTEESCGEHSTGFDADACQCVCDDGWGDARCDKKDCDKNCENGGTLDGEACTCQCPKGFVGDICEEKEEPIPPNGFDDCSPAAIFKERFPNREVPQDQAFTDECYDVVLNLCEAMSVKDKSVKNVFNYKGCMVVECANKNGKTRMTVSRLTNASEEQCKDKPESPECPADMDTEACRLLNSKNEVNEVLWDSMMCRAYENTKTKHHPGKIHKCSKIKEHLESPEGGDDPEMDDFMTCKDCKKDSVSGKHHKKDKHHEETPAILDMEEIKSEGDGRFMLEVDPVAALENNRRARAYRRLRRLTHSSIGLRGHMTK